MLKMSKAVIVIFMLFASCYCVENNELLVEDGRASKKKKNRTRIWSMILLLIFSKVVIFKVASAFLFVVLFQKFCYVIGLILNYYFKVNEGPEKVPVAMYGTPEYDTVGYSYSVPNKEAFRNQEHVLPTLSDLRGSFNWLFNKNK